MIRVLEVRVSAWLTIWQPAATPRNRDNGDPENLINLMESSTVEMRAYRANDGAEGTLINGGEETLYWLPTAAVTRWKGWSILMAGLFIFGTLTLVSTGKQSVPSTRLNNNVMASQSFLPEFTLETILQKPSSPQAVALVWLQQHPTFRSMPVWRKQQLMALLTLWLARCGYDPRLLDEFGRHECHWAAFGKSNNCTAQGQFQSLGRPPACPHEGTLQHPIGAKSWSLPPELSLLTHLNNLYLADSGLVGPIPTEVGSLTSLTFLGLRFNQMSGSIPSQLGQLTALKGLDLPYNQLSSSLPTEIGRLQRLEFLALQENQITGSLAPALQGLTKLTFLDLEKNRFEGSLPKMESMAHLETLNLKQNHLWGSLPTQLGILTALTSLHLSHNQLTGSIPTELGQLSSYLEESLNLYRNRLNGIIPTQIGQLTLLKELGLGMNQLTGSLPTQLVKLTGLTHLSLHDNPNITGPIPSSELEQLSHLQQLWLFDTSLTGTIPSNVCVNEATAWIRIDCDRVTCSCDHRQCRCM